VVDHERWQVRDQALQALGKIGDTKAAPAVMSSFEDSIGQVRKSAVVTAGQLAIDEAIPALVHKLGDEFYGARLMAVNSLLNLDMETVLETLADSLASPSEVVGDLACKILGEIGTDQAIRLLLTQIESPDPDRRAHAGVALVRADPLDNCRSRSRYYEAETDRLVRLKIESAIKSVSHE
jgi:HEAT repeat protein